MNLSDLLHQTLLGCSNHGEINEDSSPGIGDFSEIENYISQGPEVIRDQISNDQLNNIKIDKLLDNKTTSTIPGLCLLRNDESTTPECGIYIAYLFDCINNTVFLTLTQGISEAKQIAERGTDWETENILRAQAEQYRQFLNFNNKWSLQPATLSEQLESSSEYNAGTICYLEYSISDLKNNNALISDLETLLDHYDTLIHELSEWPDFETGNKQFWHLQPGDYKQWGIWRAFSIASISIDDVPPGSVNEIKNPESGSVSEQRAFQFEEEIKTGDMVVAGVKGSPSDIVFGIGQVTVGFGGTFQDEVKENIKTDVEIAGNRFIRVSWNSISERGLPITASTEGDMFDNTATFKIEQSLGKKILGQIARRLAATGTNPSPEKALESLTSGLQFDIPTGPPEGSLLNEPPISERAPFYWVDQTYQNQAGDQVLQTPRYDKWPYDLQKLNRGDHIIHYADGEIIGYSEVTKAAYLHRDNQNQELRRVDIDFEEFEEKIPLSEVFEYLRQPDVRLDNYYPVSATGVETDGYLYNLSQSAGEYLLRKGGTGPVQEERLESRLQFPGISFDINDTALYFPADTKKRLEREINAALDSGKHLIFTGPPGTGKSRLARTICESAQSEGNQDWIDGYRFTTATAEWTTFDTIGGYVPDPGSEGERLIFDPRLFLSCFRDEESNLRNEWLIIDELNRADIDKAFGELFSVLAGDSVELPYKRDQNHGNRVQIEWIDESLDRSQRRAIAQDPDRYPVTPAWRLIGTMNTFDKTSLYELSFAFMRRFSFIHVGIPPLFVKRDEQIITAEHLSPQHGPNYATVWMDKHEGVEGVLSARHEEISLLWAIINKYRPIGPAIVLDIVKHVASFDDWELSDDALSSAVTSLVFPQLEGLRQADYEELRSDLEAGGSVRKPDGSVSDIDLKLNIESMWRTATDMFQLE